MKIRISGFTLVFFVVTHSPNLYAENPPLTEKATEQATEQPLSQSAAVAQPSSLSDRILKVTFFERGTGKPLSKVEIQTNDGGKFFSGPDGKAEIKLTEASRELSLIRNGYATQAVDLVELADTIEAEIGLFPKLGGDDEVIVRGNRRPSISKKVISSNEAARVAPGGDPGQITKIMPGVTTQTGRSNITIRGSEPEDSLYLIDDIEVPFLYHTIGQLTVIPPSFIDEVEFSSGGFGSEYGNTSGGVVVARTKNEIPERARTNWTLNIPIYSGIFHERPLSENSAMSVGVRVSYLDKLLPLFLPKDSGTTIIPYFRDYHGNYLKVRDDGYSKFTLLASIDGLKATIPSEFSADEEGAAKFNVKTYFGAIAYEYSLKLSSDWTLQTTPQLVHTDSRFSVNDNRFRIKAYNFRIPLEFTQRISRTEKMYVGLEAAYIPYTVSLLLPRFDPRDPFYDFEEAPKETFDQKGNVSRLSSWISRDFQLSDFLLTPGIRAFYFSQNKRAGLDPRISMRYTLSDSNTLKIATGKYSQFPRRGESSEEYGNPKLRFAHTLQYILGLETKWDDRWESDLQVFYKEGKDLVRNDSEKKFNNEGQLRSKGAEVFVRRALSQKWFGWLAYTWSKTEDRDEKSDPWSISENDQTHVLHLAGSYNWSSVWETGGRLTTRSGSPFTETLGPSVYNSNLDKYQPRSVAASRNEERLPHYNELSVFNSNDFLFQKSKLTMRLGVEYLWIKRNVISKSPNYDYSAYNDSNSLPPIPYIELRGEF